MSIVDNQTVDGSYSIDFHSIYLVFVHTIKVNGYSQLFG